MRLPAAPEGRRHAPDPARQDTPARHPEAPVDNQPGDRADDPWAIHATPAEAPPATPPDMPAPAPRRRGFWARAARPAEAAAARLRAIPGRDAAALLPDAAPDDAAARAPATPAGPPLLGPVRALLEGFALLAALLVVDLALGARGFAYWPVHPFALPVLYVAARHGLAPGLTVAFAAGLLRIGQALLTDHWTAAAWAEPIAWPLAAALVGALVARHRRRHAAAASEAATAIAERAAIAEANDRLALRAIELEARLGARLTAATAVFEATRALGHGTEGVIRGACGLVRAATGCTACSFWLAEGGALHLVAQEGWPEGAQLSHSFARGPLIEALGESRGALVATRPADRLALGHEGILAAPVLSPWDGLILGMVKIEDIGFPDLSADTIAGLEAVAGWLGAALAEARARDAQRPAGAEPLAGLSVAAGEEATRAIGMMTNLARRVGFDLALLSAEIPSGPRAAAALDATRAAMAETFRGSDLLLEARLDERRLSVLLAGAQLRGAEAAAARLRALLADRAPVATERVVVGLAWLHAAPR